MTLFLRFLDQFRYMAGSLAICLTLCRHVLPHRKPYAARIAVSSCVCLLLAFVYIPLETLVKPLSTRFPIIIAPYWILMSFTLVWFVLYTHETDLTGALFHAMMASFAENVVTVLIRNLFVYTLFPSFPSEHPVLYIAGMVVIYVLFCFAVTRILVPHIGRQDMTHTVSGQSILRINLSIYLTYTILLSISKYVMETLILPLSGYPELLDIYRTLQIFLVCILLLLGVMMSVVTWYIYRRISLEAEKEVIIRLARERKAQYEFSKENIDMINRKTHDLKHQLQALSFVSDEERKQQIQETSRAIDFYDAVVKTGNEALDVLLTEKSVYCANRHIRLSCTVHTTQLEKIRVVDLYTLLGNALDNAIESVELLQDPEQKVISLSIRDQGSMLYIQLENYYAGQLNLQDGLPQTRKTDRENHGYGLKSIRSIVHAYGGELNLRTEGQIFYLEIMIP